MFRKLRAGSCFGLLLSLPWMFWMSIFGCASQGGAPSTPADLLAVPGTDMADGGATSDLKSDKSFLWLKHLPASDNVDFVRHLAVDKLGNVFVACQFSGPTDFGDGPRTTQGNHDIALVKFTAAGDFVWARQFGTTEGEWVLRLVTDASGNVILAGSFTDPVNVGGGVVTSHGRDDYYLAKYSGAGGLMWAKAIGSPEIERNNAGLAVDDAGNIYFAGQFNLSAMSASIDLGGGMLTSAGYADGFLAKYDPSGAHVFSKRWGGPYFDYVWGLAVDKSGDIVIGGQLTGAIDLGGGTMDPGAPGTSWAFVERLDKNGNYKWAVGFYSNGSSVTDLAIDETGAIAVIGGYAGTLQTKTVSLSSPGGRSHSYLLQLDANGVEKWARGAVSGSTADYSHALLIDGSRILVGGSFEGSGDFGLGPRTALGGGDGYLIAYSQAGAPQWLRQVGGGDDEEWFTAIARSADALYAGGIFSTTVDFGGTVLTSKGFSDGFVMKLPPPLPKSFP